MTAVGDGALRDPADRVARLLDIARIMSGDGDLTDVLNLLARKIARLCAADHCSVHLLRNGVLEAATTESGSDAPAAPGRPARTRGRPGRAGDHPGFQQALRDGQPVLFDEPRGVVPERWIETLGIRAGLILPLLRHHRRLGLLHLYNVSDRLFQAQDMELGQSIAVQIALLIDNARLVHEARTALQASRGLLAVVQAVNAASSVERVVDQISESATDVLGADACVTYLRGAGTAFTPAGVSRAGDGWLRRSDTARYIAALVRNAHDPVWTDDAVRDPRLDVVRQHGVRSMLVTPLRSREDVIGALACTWQRVSRGLSRDELRLMQTLAAYAAIGIVHARLRAASESAAIIRERLRVAQDLHEALQHAMLALESRLERYLDQATDDWELQAVVEQLRGQSRSIVSELGDLI